MSCWELTFEGVKPFYEQLGTKKGMNNEMINAVCSVFRTITGQKATQIQIKLHDDGDTLYILIGTYEELPMNYRLTSAMMLRQAFAVIEAMKPHVDHLMDKCTLEWGVTWK